eukprot:scaffold518_cov388-Prasinococcus_capsulatus_cf.AAC.4
MPTAGASVSPEQLAAPEAAAGEDGSLVERSNAFDAVVRVGEVILIARCEAQVCIRRRLVSPVDGGRRRGAASATRRTAGSGAAAVSAASGPQATTRRPTLRQLVPPTAADLAAAAASAAVEGPEAPASEPSCCAVAPLSTSRVSTLLLSTSPLLADARTGVRRQLAAPPRALPDGVRRAALSLQPHPPTKAGLLAAAILILISQA